MNFKDIKKKIKNALTEITALSIVSTPANALGFEKAQEVANALKFERKKTTISDYLKK